MVYVVFVYLGISTVTSFILGSLEPNSSNVHVSVRKASTGPPLEVVRHSPTSGYIQTPGWNRRSLNSSIMNSVVRVEIPAEHMIMFSILHSNFTANTCSKDRCRDMSFKCDSKMTLKVYETSMTDDHLAWKCRWEPNQRQTLSRGASLYVYFQNGEFRKSGFKLSFTVHEVSRMIQEVEPDLWNCSAATFADFKPHFPCDLYPQCLNKEDERDCPYFSEECGLGFATLGNRCLVLEKRYVPGTWRFMEFLCNKRGGTLVNVRTRDDHHRLVQYLQPLADIWAITIIRIGIHSALKSLPLMYRLEFQHTDKTIAFYRSATVSMNVDDLCGLINQRQDYSDKFLDLTICSADVKKNRVLCEIRSKYTAKQKPSPANIKLQSVTNSSHSLVWQLIACPLGHTTRDFFACDAQSTCWASRGVKKCSALLTPPPPSFACANGVERLPYTLICDIRLDCSDGSDENFCVFPPCDVEEPFRCSDHECVPRNTLCDGQRNCHNAADEDLCSYYKKRIAVTPPPPAIVHLSHHGQFTVHRMTQRQPTELGPTESPETHFQCPDQGYWLPVFLRCNGVYDCLGKEDEAGCNSYSCPSFYRCRSSQVCVHPEHLCDGIFQCPENDDELLCDLSCPLNCTCYGLSFYCRQPFQMRSFRNLRFLDAHNSGINVSDMTDNIMLIYLRVSGNGLTAVGKLNFPNLHNLDLSDNQLKEVCLHDFSRQPRLQVLSLSGNPLQSTFKQMNMPQSTNAIVQSNSINRISRGEKYIMPSLRMLDISRIRLNVLNTSFLSLLPNLHVINMSGGGVDTLLGEGFQALTQLRVLDLRGCPLTYFPRDVLLGLEQLETVHTDNMKMCCPAMLPSGFLLKNCHAPSDDVSSCEALLKFEIYRVVLFIFASLALLGNASSFIYRVFMQKRKRLLSFDVFVAHLCLSDFLMGVYLNVIGVADRLYQETYLWEDHNWMNSTVCHTAGFLSLVSSEVSALLICLITLERLLVIHFPFSTFHFGSRSAQLASLCVWGLGCVIAAVPFAPGAVAWQFYSKTGICIPLPVSRPGSPGYAYAFGVMIAANFIFFVVIAAGQVFIYISVQNSPISQSETTRKSQDYTIARRLITVAMSDFLCWFPICLAGLLAATGTPITGEVNVSMAIFVLPFNSALNPFLYTLNLALENRRRAAEERLLAQFKSDLTRKLQG